MSGEELFGIRHWALWYPSGRVPRFEVFFYVGQDTTTGLYLFRSLKRGDLYRRNYYQLLYGSFRPFCFDHAGIIIFLELTKEK